MSQDVAILGCGPAGLLAAHAVALADSNPIIYSDRLTSSPPARSVFLHQPIPDLPAEREQVIIGQIGRPSGYARKVYANPARTTSFHYLKPGTIDAWPLAPVYEGLWRLYSGAIRKCLVGPELAGAIDQMYQTVISTIPAPAICRAGHEFPSVPIWIEDGAPPYIGSNTMLYNGRQRDIWYRASDLWGLRSTEYASRRARGREGIKVAGTGTNCDCYPGIIRAGRWAQWKPAVLLHHAFERAALTMELSDSPNDMSPRF